MTPPKLFQKPILLFLIPMLFTACAAVRSTTKSPDVLMKADAAFSNMASEKGVRTAFLHFIDDSAVLLKADAHPIVGTAAKQYYEKQEELPLTWAPSAAAIARSGELGYTYGIWTLTLKDTTLQGTYVTVWKQDKNGNWKFVLDSGNSGLGKK